MYHYRIVLSRDEKGRPSCQTEYIEGVEPRDLPRALNYAMGALREELLDNFGHDDCPSKLDVIINFE